MGLAAILPRSSARILVYALLASWGGTGKNGRGDVECSRHCVTPSRCVSVSISRIGVGVCISVGACVGTSVGASVGTSVGVGVGIGVSVSVGIRVSILGAVGLGSVGASSRTVWVYGLAVVVLRSHFAMLQGGRRSPSVKSSSGGRQGNSTSQFTTAAFAFAQVLEQYSCNTPEAGSSHLGCVWQFCKVKGVSHQSREKSCWTVPYITHVVLSRVWVLRTRTRRQGGSHSGRQSVPQVLNIG